MSTTAVDAAEDLAEELPQPVEDDEDIPVPRAPPAGCSPNCSARTAAGSHWRCW
ncbi:hypothetical protein BX265_2479 [Streptomyces sp. TLI_235]|nr:hypothetical protein [Streptomyces sp. TLI_235]PBC77723.1 hypothetical protein BX265_2479 [Streptomyces sp. TLI_235]